MCLKSRKGVLKSGESGRRKEKQGETGKNQDEELKE